MHFVECVSAYSVYSVRVLVLESMDIFTPPNKVKSLLLLF